MIASSLSSRVCLGGHSSRRATTRVAPRFVVRAATDTQNKDAKKRQRVGEIEASLKKSGFSPEAAKEVLKRWEDDVGHEVSADDLRKVLVGQSTKILGLVALSTLLDAGAAYGSFTAGNFLGAAEGRFGLPAVIFQGIAYLLAGYYASGAVFDFFKLGSLAVAAVSFNVNAPAFLEAVEDIAGSKSGLATLDKAVAAANSVKVFQALSKISSLLKESGGGSGTDMLADLGAYLTLDRAQKNLGFDAKACGLSDAQAAEIAVVFGKYDLNGDGVLNQDEFSKLCARFAPDLNEAEVQAALQVIDLNKDGSISFDEFVKWWVKDDMAA